MVLVMTTNWLLKFSKTAIFHPSPCKLTTNWPPVFHHAFQLLVKAHQRMDAVGCPTFDAYYGTDCTMCLQDVRRQPSKLLVLQKMRL